MAEPAQIAEVQDLLPEDSDWDEAKISLYLDGGNTVPQVLLTFWRSRASKFSTMLDVSESGSSRSLSSLYHNAKAMMDYWEDQIATAKQDAKDDENDRPARITKLSRF